MWDDAPLLRNIASSLMAMSVLAVLVGAIHYALHMPGLFPLRSVHLSAAPQRVSSEAVLLLVRSELKGNFFTVNIDQVRQALEKLSWVRSVNIHREFPDGLAVQLIEHQPLAYWNNKALVNQQGEVFMAQTDQVLPSFNGPESAAAEVAQQYRIFSQQIESMNLQMEQITLSARYAWQLGLSNGMVLELGREDMQQRLARFVLAQQQEDLSRVKFVDLRYRNGFAIKQAGRG